MRSDRMSVLAETGSGISRELLPEVFDQFVQGGTTIDRADGGLGLALVKSLVELHAGQVTARSEGPGKGTKVEVSLPALPADRAPAPRAAPPVEAVAGRARILIVDDNEDAADLMGEALAHRGYDVKVVYDPVAALALAGEFDADVALLDIGLPVMNGYELAGRLRASAKAPQRPYLIAATGYGQDSDKDKAHQAGFDAHIVKPISLQGLLGLLASRQI